MERRAGFAVIRTFLAIHCLIFHSVTANEPRCSSFSYEASTLEKMIRTEIKVEQMRQEIEEEKESIKETEKNVANMLKQLKAQTADMEAILGERESNIGKAMHELEDRIVSELKEAVSTPNVIFYARDVADTSPATGQTFVFLTTVQNEGQGYDNATGQFTAPVAGLYHFSIQLCGRSGKVIAWDMMTEGNIVKSGVFHHGQNSCGTLDIGRILSKGERVWVRCSSADTGTFLRQDRYRHNTYAGYLVNRP